MSYTIIVQNTLSQQDDVPKPIYLQRWATCALNNRVDTGELCIRIVDKNESEQLNSNYRKKQAPTNVLSFPSDIPHDVALEKPYLGDLILCADIINQEAEQQNKSLAAHWAHIVIHGVLHILGYDHIKDEDAKVMEALEIELLDQLGYRNPYAGDE